MFKKLLTVLWLNTNDYYFANSQVIKSIRKAITRPERPKPAQKGQKETNRPFSVMRLFSRTHAWVSRVVSYPTAFNIGIIIFITVSVITNNSAWLKSFVLSLVIGISNFRFVIYHWFIAQVYCQVINKTHREVKFGCLWFLLKCNNTKVQEIKNSVTFKQVESWSSFGLFSLALARLIF